MAEMAKKYAFGIDLGGTTVKIGLFSGEGELVYSHEIPTRTENGGVKILPDIAEAVREDMILRDKQDSTRAVSPLVVAEGATVIDTSKLNFEESVDAVIKHIRSNIR